MSATQLQETLVTLVAKLPDYRYVPEEKGHFHNYLTGTLRRKALRACANNKRLGEVLEGYRHEPAKCDTDSEREMQTWREAVYEIALEQVLPRAAIAEHGHLPIAGRLVTSTRALQVRHASSPPIATRATP